MTTTEPKPSGLDLQWVDPDVRPQDDLFTHVNGRWLRTHEIPEDRSQDGAFRVLRDRAEEQVRAIVEECAAGGDAPGTDAQRIGARQLKRLRRDTILRHTRLRRRHPRMRRSGLVAARLTQEVVRRTRCRDGMRRPRQTVARCRLRQRRRILRRHAQHRHLWCNRCGLRNGQRTELR